MLMTSWDVENIDFSHSRLHKYQTEYRSVKASQRYISTNLLYYKQNGPKNNRLSLAKQMN